MGRAAPRTLFIRQQARQWHGRGQGLVAVAAEGEEPLHHQRQGILVEVAQVVEQAVAHLTAPAGASRDAGKKRDEGGLPGVGQDDGPAVGLALQRPADATAREETELAVTQRHLDSAAYLRHARQQGRAPGGSEYIDGVSARCGEVPVQGLGHDHVADPGRADHEDTARVTRHKASGRATLRPPAPAIRCSARDYPARRRSTYSAASRSGGRASRCRWRGRPVRGWAAPRRRCR